MQRRTRGTGSIRREGTTWAIGRAGKYESGFRSKVEAERRLALLSAEAVQRRLGVAADPKLSPPSTRSPRPGWSAGSAPTLRATRMCPGGSATVRVAVALLSSLFEVLLERGLAQVNPARHLPKSILHMMRPTPRQTAFVARRDDVRRVFLDLPEPVKVAYVIGAYAGLRTSEIRLLEWLSVDLVTRRIIVQKGGRKATKDREIRTVPILDALHPILKEWRLRHPGAGLVIPPMRSDGEKIDKSTLGTCIRAALKKAGLHEVAAERKAWYAATRHTFASQWAMAGGSIPELQKILGHASIEQTMEYAKLAPGYFSPGVHGLLGGADTLARPAATVVEISGETAGEPRRRGRNHKGKAGAAL